MNQLEKYLNNSLQKLDHKIFKDVIKIETDIKPMDDGQVVVISEVKRVVLTLTKTNGEMVKVNTIAKVEMETETSQAGKNLAADCGAFETETLMYSKILKTMENLMKTNSDDKTIWPDCYFCTDNKFIFPDLCDIGYKIVPTYKFLDAEHTLLVMEGIAKFHALSMVIKERALLDLSQLREPFFSRINSNTSQMLQFAVGELIKTMRESWEPEWFPIADRVEEYFSNGNRKCHDVWKNTKGKWDVICHGDFSMRNMLFHYPSNSSHPDAVKFVDFQMCNVSTFAFDIVSILYSSILPSVRDKNMELFIATYTSTLSKILNEYNYKRGIPSVQDVRQQMKEVTLFSTLLSIFNLPFFLESEKADIQDKAHEYIKSYGDAESAKGMIDYNDENVKELVKSELRRCMDEKIF